MIDGSERDRVLVAVDSLPQGGVDPLAWRVEQHVKALTSCPVDVTLMVVGPDGGVARCYGVPVLYTGLDLGEFFRRHERLYGVAVLVGGGTAHRFSAALREHQPHAHIVVDSSTLLSIERPRLPDHHVRSDERGGRERIAALRRQRDAELVYRADAVWTRSAREAAHVRSLGVGPDPLVVAPVVSPVSSDRGERVLALLAPHREFGEPDLEAFACLRDQVAVAVGAGRELVVATERLVPGWDHVDGQLKVELRDRPLVDHLDDAALLVVARAHGPTAWVQILAAATCGVPIVATPEAVRAIDTPREWGIEVAPIDEIGTAVRAALSRDRAQPVLARPAEDGHLLALGLLPDAIEEPTEWLCAAMPSRHHDVAVQGYLRTPGHVGEDPDPDSGAALTHRPLVSVLTPVYDPPLEILEEMIGSVLSQSYENWELVLVDDASPNPEVRAVCEKFAERQRRIVFVPRAENGGIAAASNTALGASSGEFVALLDHDDLLREDALIELVRAINTLPSVDVLYSDEDKLFEDGAYDHAYAKAAWSPDLHLSYNYTCHFACFRREVLVAAGGWRLGFDGAQDYDLALRVTELTQQVVHIPRNLYHWRVIEGSTSAGVDQKSDAWDAGRRALVEAMERRGLDATVEEGINAGTYHVSYPPSGRPTVGVIIPTRDRIKMLSAAVEDLHDRTSWSDIDVLIVDNESVEPESLEWLAEHDGPILEYPHQFSYARMMNLAAEQIDADLLLFLNNDVEVESKSWIDTMIGYSQQRRVGAVGARLLFPDGRVQHEGVVLGVGGVAGNVDSRDYFSLGSIERNCFALTAACLMIRPDVFWEVGGFEERLRVAFNDVDLTMRIHQLGYDLIYTPHAELTHQESASRGSLHPEEDEAFFLRRWGPWDDYVDPYYNPRLSTGVQYMFEDEVRQIWVPKSTLA